jgi:hypothetical protein
MVESRSKLVRSCNLHCSGPCLDHYQHDVGTSQIGVAGGTRGVDPESKDGL